MLGEILLKHNEPMDMPMGANAPNTYITGVKWAPEQGQRAGVCGGRTSQDRWARALQPTGDSRPMPGLEDESDDEEMDFTAPVSKQSKVRSARPPRAGGIRTEQEATTALSPQWLTEDQCIARLRDSGVDWSEPYLHPGKNARHREALAHSISPDEQAQAHYMGLLLAQLELEETTKKSYADGLKKFLVYLNRGYPLCDLSADHERLAMTGLFEPAVWKDHKVEKVLLDTVLHEVGVRGNAWSTVRVQMYAYGIRHHNVSKGMPNPLSNKLRHDQLMRALKKFRGPKAGKSPATRAMLFALCKELDWETDLDDLIQYAAVLTAFHFMLRSAQYSARLKNGKFDLDRVSRLMDVRFYVQGVQIYSKFHLAEEVEVKRS